MDLMDLTSPKTDCACGRTHRADVRHIHTGTGALASLSGILEPFAGRTVFVIGDENTMPLAGDAVTRLAEEAGCTVRSHTFVSRRHLILDEKLIGNLLIHLPQETAFLVAIGSGTLNDLARVIAGQCRIPYAIVGTAPSMDGFASSVSPIVTDEGKHSKPFGVPHAVICDSALLQTAPMELLSAGCGDVLGKYVALCDWKLATREVGEHSCDFIAGLVAQAVERCMANTAGVAAREPQALTDMADTLILSGLCISMYGASRPASGCEHQLAHYWEVALLRATGDAPLHGNLVGVGTQVACRLYELAAEEFPLEMAQTLPTRQQIARKMAQFGEYATLATIGVSRELFHDSFFHANEANGRFTLLGYLQQQGRIGYYADRLTDEFFIK